MNKFFQSSDLPQIREKLHLQGKKVVLTYGTFDLIHSGHGAYLVEARNAGDFLIVAVASNKSKKELRGKGFPIVDQKNRADLLTYFDFVNGIVFADERNLLPVIKKLKPDIFYTNSLDWKSHLRKAEEEKYIKKYGGKIIKKVPNMPFISSASIVDMVADLKIKEVVEYFFGKIQIDLQKGNWGQNKFSGLKTKVRHESLKLPNHLDSLGLFGEQFRSKIITNKELKAVVKKLKNNKQKIVFSAGSCDLLHSGHARFFSKGHENGDVLILGIPSDVVIRKQKGRGRPIISEYSRAELMCFFEFVDYIYIFGEDSVIPLLQSIEPDVFFTVQEDWNDLGKTPISDMISKWGGKIVTAPPQASGLSSSKLIKKAAGIRVREVFKEVLDEAKKQTSLKD